MFANCTFRSFLFPERLRKGTVDLIHTLQDRGVEVWVYTSSYRTVTYIKALFRHYGVHFDDIVNGERHEKEVQGNKKRPMPTKMPGFYHISLHVDDEISVVQNGQANGFRVIRVYEPDPRWADKILAEVERIEKFERLQAVHDEVIDRLKKRFE